MSYLAVPDESSAGEETRALLARARESHGYVPNHTAVFGPRPAVHRAWQQLSAAVQAPMTARRYELATLGAARALRSSYCSLAHGEVLVRDHLPAGAVAALATGADDVDLAPAERAVVDFAAKVARSAPDVTPDDVDALRAQGLDDEEILDVVLAAAIRCFFSTVLDATGTLPDAVLRTRLEPSLLAALTVGRPVADA